MGEQVQDYEVNYKINVEVTDGARAINNFSRSMENLTKNKTGFGTALANIRTFVRDLEAVFAPNGRKKDHQYKLSIDTGESEARLIGIKTMLTEIQDLAKGVKLEIKTTKAVNPADLKAKAKSLIDKKQAEIVKPAVDGKTAVENVREVQRSITKIIGKINAALVSLEKGREINIKTDVAKERLLEILALTNRIKGATNMTLGTGMGSPGHKYVANYVKPPMAYIPIRGFVLPKGVKVQDKNVSKLLSSRQYAAIGKSADAAVKKVTDAQEKITESVKKTTEALATLGKGYEIDIKTEAAKERLMEVLSLVNQIKRAANITVNARKIMSAGKGTALSAFPKVPYVYHPVGKLGLPSEIVYSPQKRNADAEINRAAKEKASAEKKSAAEAVRAVRGQQRAAVNYQTSKQRAAINRMQYMRRPSIRALPFMQMVNAYAMYGLLRSEMVKAVEYSNIMTSAQSILRVADKDLSTFENRFSKMAQFVRQIGVETKFTAVEVAGAVKYLSMAGMDIETINKSIRPITNLALIGDNDVAQIADLTTNIMAGYNIKNTSMESVADIIASTVSRSNVNVIEMAEAFKMSAGYMRLTGVKFTESSAAIGILGNAGIKATMAGTALRAMATRFAKPTREAKDTLDRLGVKFTEYQNIYGKQVERLRPLADIFEDLNRTGATVGDIQAIFGKIGGNAGMMLLNNYKELRELTEQNALSHGISSELAQVKQENTKGLWAQVTSQLTESFMQAYEILEPIIKSTLRDFLEKFKAPEFAKGLVVIGQAVLDILSVLGKVAAWVTSNFHWIEPLLFTGVAATKLFKLAGALTNVGVAMGFIGKQSAAGGALELISSLAGLGGGKMSYGKKRSIVSALKEAGISGKGAMKQALRGGYGGMAARSGLGLLSTQVVTGNGLLGAGASIGALGSTAVAATAGIAALVGALGWVAYKTWQVKKAKDAVLQDVDSKKKYHYKSIEDMNAALAETYKTALAAKKAVDDLEAGKKIEEESGQKIGAFTGNWWMAFLSLGAASGSMNSGPLRPSIYSLEDARQDDARQAIKVLADKEVNNRIGSMYDELGKLTDDIGIEAFIQRIDKRYKQEVPETGKDGLWVKDGNGNAIYDIDKLKDLDVSQAHELYDYAVHVNQEALPKIKMLSARYKEIMSSPASARKALEDIDFDFGILKDKGFYLNKNGIWEQKPVSDKDVDAKIKSVNNAQDVHEMMVAMAADLRQKWGGNPAIAKNILQKAGFPMELFSSEPDQDNDTPFDDPDITFHDGDDGMSGGNYSGSGKLSSAAPKQVIVNITNLLSVETIKLLKSENGELPEIQNLKEELAQALIDVVHDFDASWNG